MMNDRYLFRGWDRWANTRHIGGLVAKDTPTGTDYWIMTPEGNEYLVDTETIGQCTGMKDRNGTLLFEDDIWKGSFGEFIIEWNDFYTKFVLRDPRKLPWTEINRDLIAKGRIAGNIHEKDERS